jgi:hypothetical protein
LEGASSKTVEFLRPGTRLLVMMDGA